MINNHSKYIRSFLFLCSLIILAIFGASCSNTRYLQKGETLYVGSKVVVKDTLLSKSQKKALASTLEENVRPHPNRSFLGLRFRLWVYNLAGEPKLEYGIRYWLRNKIGEPPVLGSDLNLKVTSKVIDNYLYNLGYFSVSVSEEKTTKRKRTKALFIVHPNYQDSIREVTFQLIDSSNLSKDIYNLRDHTLLRKGYPYNLNVIIAERERIAQDLKNDGYYYFNPEYIIIEADTGVSHYQVDLTVKLKSGEIPENALYRYKINKVTIIPNYSLRTESDKESQQWMKYTKQNEDTTYYKGYGIVGRQQNFKPYVFYQSMQLKPGEYYNLKDQNIALNRLVNIGAFKFVKNKFNRVQNTNDHLLDLTYYLSPYPKKSLSANIGGYSQSDSRLGSRASISWKNHNTFHGAEVFYVKLSGGFDMQYGGTKTTPNLYNLGIETGLNFPRFLVPFFSIQPSSLYVPRTLLKASYNLSLGKDYYKIYSFNLGFGYNWKESATKEHELFPINLSYVKTDTLGVNPGNLLNLSQLTFNGIIIGPSYEYTFNSQLGNKQRIDNYFFTGRADFSGNILGLIQGTSLDKNPIEILGQRYAQYAKIESDFRYYHNYTKDKILATRIFLGFGIPYGNSHSLPNIKQFFSGGSSSLRGFGSRLVGPGTYHYNKANNNDAFIEMLGDMKLEMNLEYRLPVYQFIKAAFFMDAGNIWLYRKNNDLPGAVFTSNFYKQLAVDAGAGLRLDFSILVLRFDLGIPIRKPWFQQGSRWVLDDIRFGDPEWRNNNLFLNLAIGYPF